MTLLMAAPTTEDSIVIAADMREIGGFPQLHWNLNVKLKQLVDTHSGVVLMWGYAGSIVGGKQFEGMMRSTPQTQSWSAFADHCAYGVGLTNQNLLCSGRPADRIGAFAAGFIGQEPGIIKVTEAGAITGPGSLDFRCIGSVGQEAYEKWGTTNQPMTTEQVKDKMAKVFDAIMADHYESIGPPWNIWELTPGRHPRQLSEYPTADQASEAMD